MMKMHQLLPRAETPGDCAARGLQFWTCNNPNFYGCCSMDPCSEKGCTDAGAVGAGQNPNGVNYSGATGKHFFPLRSVVQYMLKISR
jgi:hypothetical protein